jgi:hypothetical protein
MRTFQLRLLLVGPMLIGCGAPFFSKADEIAQAGAAGEGSEGGADMLGVSGRSLVDRGGRATMMSSSGGNAGAPDAGTGGIASSSDGGSSADPDAGTGSKSHIAAGGMADSGEGGIGGFDMDGAGTGGEPATDDGECDATGLLVQIQDPNGRVVTGINVALDDPTKLEPYTAFRDVLSDPQIYRGCAATERIPSGHTVYFVWQFIPAQGTCCNATGCGALKNYTALVNGGNVEVRQESYVIDDITTYALAVTAP